MRRRGRLERPDGEDASWVRRGNRMLEDAPAEDVRREVAFHIEMKAAELEAEGWSAEEARAEARRLFGDATAIEAECTEIAGRHRRTKRRAWQLDSLVSDIRIGMRVLRRRPVFTIVGVLTLALGIGANAAVFSVIQNLLLEPLPYPSQGELVELLEVTADGHENAVAEPNYFDWKSQSRSFSSMASIRGPGEEPGSVAVSAAGRAEPFRRPLTIVSAEFFETMGMQPMIGRLPSPGELTGPVVVVSHRLWTSLLHETRDLSSVSMSALGGSAPVVAVMPEGFDYPTGTDIWVAGYPNAGGTRTSHNYTAVVARLAPGVTLAAAQSEMQSIGARLATLYAGDTDAQSVRVTRLSEALFGSFRSPLLLLFAAAGAVLLVACANMASSLLARAAAREREVAIRASVGAGRLRVVRQFLTESVLLALLAGLAGLVLAGVLLRVLQSIEPSGVLRMREMQIGLPTFAFTFFAAVLAAGVFGVVPALRSSGIDVATLLRSGERGGSHRRTGLWNVLVAGEVALALMLLLASGLLIRSFRALLDVEQGFDPDGVVAVGVYIPRNVAPNDTAVSLLESRLLESLRRLPGVASAGLVSALPGTSQLNGGVNIDGSSESAYAEYRVAEEGYFETLRIPIVRGRSFGEQDRLGTETVALVNEAFAARFFPDGDAVGATLRDLRNDGFYYGPTTPLKVIGIVGSVRPRGQLRTADATVYVLQRQRAFRSRGATLTLRLRGNSPATLAAVRNVIATTAPEVPIDVASADALLSAPLAARRFVMLVVAGFGLLTLTLSAVGIYGVVAWSVQQRTREMGIRIALGAIPGRVAGRVIRESMVVVAVGLTVGIVASIAGTRLLGGFLVGTAGLDIAPFAIATLLLAAVAMVASAIPASRAARIDPIASMRME